MSEFAKGALPYRYWEIEGDTVKAVAGGIIDEVLLTIYINGEEIATIMSSPIDQEALTLGFLYNEGVINAFSDVALLRLNVPRTVADVFLTHSNVIPPRRLTITSGCGGGITLQDLAEKHPPLQTDFHTTSAILLTRMREMQGAATLYNQVRGVHTAALADEDTMLLSAEDVGRHNTIDKLAGKALQNDINTRDKILFSSGRISSEMAHKARRLGIPIVVSRTAATGLAIQLADAWGICLIGYTRRNSMRVYTHPKRVGISE